MRALHVMDVLPWPPRNGYRSDIWPRLKTLRRLGFRVDLLTTAPKSALTEEARSILCDIAEDVRFVKRTSVARCAMSAKPMAVARSSTLAHVPLRGFYDLVVTESEHVMPIFSNPSLRAGLRVLRVHNDECKYMGELARAAEGTLWKAYYFSEQFKYRWMKSFPMAEAKIDQWWHISRQSVGINEFQDETVRWLPPSLEPVGETAPAPARDSRVVLFVGGLGNPLNREAVRWYANSVHPALHDCTGYRLIVAGSAGNSRPAQDLAAWLRRIPRCDVFLDLDSLDPIYREAAIIINPMRRGSGVKLKTIHAIQQGIPLVTTSTGAEGSGFEDPAHLRIADDPASYAQAIRELFADPQQGREMTIRAFRFLRENYDCERNLRSLLCLL